MLRDRLYNMAWEPGSPMGAFLLVSCALLLIWGLWESRKG